MPELPEVETTRRGIQSHLTGQVITEVVIRESRLRWPIPAKLKKILPGQVIKSVGRRAKYLLVNTDSGTLLIHLGMSGSLRILPLETAYASHDRFVLNFSSGKSLRFNDPRRFGAVLWAGKHPEQHPLLSDIGPEPMDEAFSGDYLYRRCRKRKRAIRDLLLDSHIVAGIGNIYANEALFLAGIRPTRAAGRISHNDCNKLVRSLRDTLVQAIAAGGTTLRDFHQADGQPGYFQQTLNVYQRTGEPCRRCGRPIRAKKLGGRTVFYCTNCQL